ncbi:hypothetical protein [Paraburkholderia sp. CNPSo 3274]|uniref:hypothetical protein n=1 Tax=Paraburkholderia sp. CNPSo 3274 TaxID=2940932 RepID=UPI0035CD0977
MPTQSAPHTLEVPCWEGRRACRIHIARTGKLQGVDLEGATLYSTLEPCTHRNHPKVSCTDRVIDRKLKRVVIGTLDPNQMIRGLGELRLQDGVVSRNRRNFGSPLISGD